MPRWKILTGLAAVALVAAACTSSPDTGSTVPAEQGATQPEGGGTAMSESDACQAIAKAEDQARNRLSCGATSHASCPDYIRPNGEACLEYDQETVEQCAKAIGAYTSCDDFANHPCFVTPIAGSAPKGCTAQPDAGNDALSESSPPDSGGDAQLDVAVDAPVTDGGAG
jgi:hypothetical protein